MRLSSEGKGHTFDHCEDMERYLERKRERLLSPTELRRHGQTLTAAEANQTESKYAVAAYTRALFGMRTDESLADRLVKRLLGKFH